MKKQKRKILMLIENTPVHPKDLELSNIELFYFPPNTTSLVQSLDQGIIKAFKDGYKKNLLFDIISKMDLCKNLSFEHHLQKITIMDAIFYTIRSWQKISDEPIINCFNKALKNSNNMPTKDELVNSTNKSIYMKNFDDFEIPMHSNIIDEDVDLIQNIIKLNETDQNESFELKIYHDENLSDTKCQNDNVITYAEAFKAVENLEKYFLCNNSGKIDKIWDIEELLNEEKKSRDLKITDFVFSKK
ncbi:Tigger transposable element-derived protein 6 [Dictyocoela muelleri]|nr:Tigger transposable element-derived protein 6 [Dictyocoela muelleri]